MNGRVTGRYTATEMDAKLLCEWDGQYKHRAAETRGQAVMQKGRSLKETETPNFMWSVNYTSSRNWRPGGYMKESVTHREKHQITM